MEKFSIVSFFEGMGSVSFTQDSYVKVLEFNVCKMKRLKLLDFAAQALKVLRLGLGLKYLRLKSHMITYRAFVETETPSLRF